MSRIVLAAGAGALIFVALFAPSTELFSTQTAFLPRQAPIAADYGSMSQYRYAQQPVMYVQPEPVQQQSQSEGLSSALGYGAMGFGVALAAAAFFMPETARERRIAMFATTMESPLIMDTSKAPKPYLKHKEELMKTASYIASPGKGILASDESTGTCALRLKDIGMEGTIDEQRGYRQMLYTTPGLSEHIAGAIMFEKTLYESTDDGVPFVKVLADQGILSGIKVDRGLKKIDGTDDGETWTWGLDDLKERCAKYYEQGARFAKWRNVLYITDSTPTDAAILDCVTTLAQYAATCQAEGLVPIVEPEVSLDGDHDIETTKEVTRKVWKMQYEVLQQYGVLMEGMLFKPAMIVPGADSGKKESAEKVAKYTLDVMKETVPPTMAGITFLSGGQSEEEATQHIQAMAEYMPDAPWNVSFSFARALQSSMLKTWGGKPENMSKAQDQLRAICQVNGLAQMGKYTGEIVERGHPSTTGSLYEKGYQY
jgi:fructose-bisphosphate aldolase class I